MQVYFIYILKCADDSYYIGVTNNIERRMEEHNLGKDEKSYTAKRLPLKLVYFETFSNPSKAIAREKNLKGWSRKKKEALIAEQFEKLRELAKKQNFRR